jgi:hypothetical protein
MIRLASALIACVLTLPVSAQTPTWDDPAWYAAPPAPLDLSMTVDGARAVSAVIGPAGGTFAAQGANGDTYTLTIPEGALFTDTTIAIWPVATVAGMPEGAGPFSGVILEPEGLQLARTGWLEITPAVPIPAESRALWGFYAAGADARGEINWPGVGDRIVIPLDHFSGAGVSIADRINLQLDRWRQRQTEDRVRSQIGEALRQQRAVLQGDPNADIGALNRELGDLLDRLGRTIARGYQQILANPAAGCADVEATIQSILALDRQREMFGVAPDANVQAAFAGLFDRYWNTCFPEQLQICLRTGDLQTLVTFAAKFERMRQFILYIPGGESAFGRIEGQVRAALERCGRFELEVTSQGTYTSDGGGSGTYGFSARIPMRLTMQAANGFSFQIFGEGPPTNIVITPSLPPYTSYQGHRVTSGMAARLTKYEFATDDSHQPVRLEALVSAPGIIADFVVIPPRFPRLDVPTPLVEGSWYLAHREDLGPDAYKLRRFQPRSHPVLWEMEWVGQGQEDDTVMSDGTRFRLIHIAQ